MTLIFDGNLVDFVGVFGGCLSPVMGEEALSVLTEAAQEMEGNVKINISNGRYKLEMNIEGEAE